MDPGEHDGLGTGTGPARTAREVPAGQRRADAAAAQGRAPQDGSPGYGAVAARVPQRRVAAGAPAAAVVATSAAPGRPA